MANNLRVFQTTQEYNNADLVLPSVSYVVSENGVHYDLSSPEPPTPPQSDCYGVTYPSITAYTSTTYSSVYSFSDAKWYMLNNLNQYEEYGVYGFVEDIASATTYEGKLAVVGEIEYQFNNGSWEEVGTYVDVSVTYEIDDTASERYRGQELLTTFKIPTSDVESVGWVNLGIRSNDGGELSINLDGGQTEYTCRDSELDEYYGTVTNDGEYFYLSLPSEAPQSIVIDNIDYWSSTPIHLIVGSKQVTVEYEEKEIPLANVYNTVEDMEDDACPNIGVGQYGVVGNVAYQFDGEDWNSVSNYKLMEKNADGKANVIVCNSSTDLVRGETQPSYFGDASGITYAEIGSCITSIGQDAFYGCGSLTSVTIGSGVTSISQGAFYQCSSLTSIDIPSGVTSIGYMAFNNCSSLTSITIPNSVTTIGENAFNGTPWWNTYSADTSHRYGNIIYINDIAYKATSSVITSCTFREGTVSISTHAFSGCKSLRSINIPNSVTSIGDYAFYYCNSLTSVTIGSGVTSIGNGAFYYSKSLTSITVNATVPPTLGGVVFNNTNNCPIYVPAASLNAYKSASGWSTYASRIQAIPT